MKPNKAVFIDRDDTISPDVHYCSRPEDFELFPDVPDAIRQLNACGFKVVVITNQSGIGRGYFTEETLAKIHDKMHLELEKHGAHLDAVYYCPHHPDENCDCRKPKPALLLKAAEDLKIDVAKSYMVGDSTMDVELARTVGCKAAVVTGQRSVSNADFIAATFADAVKWIQEQENL
ncbi:MAG: D-glycero-beta-D-manno-heptose 1,7-bisphosphate 7-phosphatase [Dehalococcoidia bacterium]